MLQHRFYTAPFKIMDVTEDKKKETKKPEDESAEEDTNTVTDELEEVVFVMKPDGTVEKRVVKTGIQDINYIEIVNGLKAGEQVVTAPYNAVSKTLKNGTKVTVTSKEKLFEKK